MAEAAEGADPRRQQRARSPSNLASVWGSRKHAAASGGATVAYCIIHHPFNAFCIVQPKKQWGAPSPSNLDPVSGSSPRMTCSTAADATRAELSWRGSKHVRLELAAAPRRGQVLLAVEQAVLSKLAATRHLQ